jgi:hypothetical protein
MNQIGRREPPAVLLLLWALLCLVMWFWAILGPIFVVLGALSFFLDLEDLHISIMDFGGQPVQTIWQKLTFMGVGVVLGAFGGGFLWLRHQGWLRYGLDSDEKPTIPADVQAAARAHFSPGEQRSATEGFRHADDSMHEQE